MGNDEEVVDQTVPNWPVVQSGPLMAGGILIGIGALVALVGTAIAGTHVIAAIRSWSKDLETPPDQLARLKWEQAKAAATAGAATWQGHPNAQVRLARRASSDDLRPPADLVRWHHIVPVIRRIRRYETLSPVA